VEELVELEVLVDVLVDVELLVLVLVELEVELVELEVLELVLELVELVLEEVELLVEDDVEEEVVELVEELVDACPERSVKQRQKAADAVVLAYNPLSKGIGGSNACGILPFHSTCPDDDVLS
jgi:hypothetical protein